MNSTLLITALIVYILSLATSLVLAIAAKKFHPGKIRLPIYLHLVLVLLAAIAWTAGYRNHFPYLILLAVCSALAIAGWVLRIKTLAIPTRIYFGLYFLTVLLFLLSPSLLIYTITGLNSERQEEKRIFLRDNYYLVEQSSLQSTSNELQYKLVRKSGMYQKTIQRDISFGYLPDSVHILKLTADTILLRAFHNGKDSSDLGLSPSLSSTEIIQKKH